MKRYILMFIFILILIFLIFLNLFYTNAKHNKHIENMENLDSSLNMDKYEDFCKFHEGPGSRSKLEKACNNLTKDNCGKVSCCVHINGNKCVAGSKNGHTYKTDQHGDKIQVDYYYYKNKCVGTCPK
jgi:hypothetical protein